MVDPVTSKIFGQIGSIGHASTGLDLESFRMAIANYQDTRNIDANGNGTILWQGMPQPYGFVQDANGGRFVDTNPNSGKTEVWVVRNFQIVSKTPGPSLGADSPWATQATGDINGDGRPDVLWQNKASGDVGYWTLDPTTGDFMGYTALPNVGANSGWDIVGVGDLDADGRDEVVWRNPNASGTYVWTIAADGTYTGGYDPGLGAVGADWVLSTVSDVNGDGREDLNWVHPATLTQVDWLSVDNGAGVPPAFQSVVR